MIKYFYVLIAILFSNAAFAEIYKCSDANGSTVYSDTECAVAIDREKVVINDVSTAPPGWWVRMKSSLSSLYDRAVAGFSSKARQYKSAQQFQCTGKVHCSQMSSCSEAIFYLNNCPGVMMDGDGDGVPCERQWCN